MFLCPPYLMNDGMMIMTSSTYSSEALIVSTKAKLKALMVIYDCIGEYLREKKHQYLESKYN